MESSQVNQRKTDQRPGAFRSTPLTKVTAVLRPSRDQSMKYVAVPLSAAVMACAIPTYVQQLSSLFSIVSVCELLCSRISAVPGRGRRRLHR